MSGLTYAFQAIGDGLRFATQFNPMVALITAAVAAAIAGYPRARHDRRQWALVIVVAGWLIGDGLRVLGRARDVYDGYGFGLVMEAPAWVAWVTLFVWAAGSYGLGYLGPALVGAEVGRRVTHGTGWLAAAGIAAALVLAIATAVGALGTLPQ